MAITGLSIWLELDHNFNKLALLFNTPPKCRVICPAALFEADLLMMPSRTHLQVSNRIHPIIGRFGDTDHVDDQTRNFRWSRASQADRSFGPVRAPRQQPVLPTGVSA
jgi:hypothetical protein